MANGNNDLIGNFGSAGNNVTPGLGNFMSELESGYENLPKLSAAAASASAAARTPAPMPSANVLAQLRRPSSFTPGRSVPTYAPRVSVNANYTRHLKVASNISNAFIEKMKPEAKVALANSLAAIERKQGEIATLANAVEKKSQFLGKAIADKQGLGALPAGNLSFRGKNSPQVYVAPNPTTGELEVRGNFMEMGHPFRVTNPNSFNAVLRNMKAKRKNVSQKVPALTKLTNESKALEKAYNVKKGEFDVLMKKLQKDYTDFLRKQEVERARLAQQELRALSAAQVPSSSQLGRTSSLTTTATQALAPPSAPKPGVLSRIGSFFRGKPKQGGTRKRRGSRKTRKGRKANRR